MTGPTFPFAIVDFAEGGDLAVRRRFESPRAVHRATTLAEVVPVIEAADRAAQAGQWAVGFVAYEAAAAFDPAFAYASGHSLPLAWFAIFDAPLDVPGAANEPRSHAQRAAAMGDPSGDDSGSTVTAAAAMSDAEHADAVRLIQENIAAGDVYQVNLTVPFSAALTIDPLALYERMRRAQGASYGCYLDIGDARIMSASPELFFERRQRTVRTRPMKGTAPRGLYPRADTAARDALLGSEKDRAENVMIVDVARNDLGRIAEVGSVRVASLYEAERYPSVWQLTSTVEATVDASLTLVDLFGALFPPASVTGAPKVRATRLIRELERAPRGVYCGAIGVVRPGGDATFNVAIRTAWTATGSGELHLNAGGGITIDSTPRGELREVGAKLAAFTRYSPPPGLFETIRVEEGRCLRLERHLERLSASAAYFDIPFDRVAALRTLDAAIAARATPRGGVARARLELAPSGGLSGSVTPHSDRPGSPPVVVGIATTPVDAADVRLYHKTTDRRLYDAALAGAPGMFDVILWNVHGLATELTRGNLVVEIDNQRLTPPVECGLLAGTLRSELLDRGEIRESLISLEDLHRADRLWFVNSLRGWVPIGVGPTGGAKSDV